MERDFDALEAKRLKLLSRTFVKRPDRHLADIPVELEDEGLMSWQWFIHAPSILDDPWQAQEVAGELPRVSELSEPQRTGKIPENPIDIIRLFCACHEWGIYPPGWIMDDLYQRFSGYMADNLGGEKFDAGIGNYFDETNRRGKFRDFALESSVKQAAWLCGALYHWFRTPKSKAIDICGAWLEDKQLGSNAPWPNENRPKGIAALRKEYSKYSEFIEQRQVNIRPPDTVRLGILERIGEQFLAEDPDLKDELKRLRKLKRLREIETKK